MATRINPVQVTLAADGFYPRTFRWEGSLVRVLSVERVARFGKERRYWVRSAKGIFELGFYTDSGIWHLRRKPTWLDRLWAHRRSAPRYRLPAWRLRTR